jgi:hypothetical protein
MSIDKSVKEEKGGVISITGKDNEEMYLYSILPEAIIKEKGLLNVAVVGQFSDTKKDKKDNIVVDAFQANPDFVNFFHEFLANVARYSKPLLAQLPQQKEGSWLYLIDQRVKDVNAAIEPKDIIGGFMVEKGKLGEYAGNPSHELLTEDGIFHIGVELKNELINLIQSKYQPN